MVKSSQPQPQSVSVPELSDNQRTTSPGEPLDVQWQRVRARLRVSFGDAAFNSWLKPLALADEGLARDGDVHLAVPTRFMRDWVANHYSERLREIWRLENADVRRVVIHVRPTSSAQSQQAGKAMAATVPAIEPGTPAGMTSSRPAPVTASVRPALQVRDMDDVERELSAPLDPRFTFDSFITGKSNELARAAALRVAESPTVTYNPLFLYGGVGLGKTHLMHAIGWHIRQRFPERRVVYLSAEKFMYQFIRALRFKDTMAFKEQFRSVDVLMIDDIQFIAGKESTQEEFFHTFN
ncbi:MAG: DnaA/Hda family protein, partial [Ferrovibrio sp.]